MRIICAVYKFTSFNINDIIKQIGGENMEQRNNIIYKKAKEFANKFPGTVIWRLKKHCSVAQKMINEDEEVLYVFAAQKGPSALDILSTHVVVLTDKRLVVAQKRLLFGYFYYNITPDMFNDFTIKMGLIWGRAIIDTIKEKVVLSNLSSSALEEIETVLSKYIIQMKRKYKTGLTDEEKSDFANDLKSINDME